LTHSIIEFKSLIYYISLWHIRPKIYIFYPHYKDNKDVQKPGMPSWVERKTLLSCVIDMLCAKVNMPLVWLHRTQDKTL